MKLFYTSFLMVMLVTASAYSQCMIVDIPLEQRTASAVQIVEGRVIDQRSFWDDKRQNIFTANRIEIYKILKGDTDLIQLDLLTRGGTVGMDAQQDHPSLQVKLGDVGLFFLRSSKEQIVQNEIAGLRVFEPEAGPQSFVEYSEDDGFVRDPFNAYEDLKKEFYNPIERQLSRKAHVVHPYAFEKEQSERMNNKMMTFTFSPSSITAGTDAILTITDPGGGLGSQGTVEFTNANESGSNINVDALDTEICSWTTTEIQVQVPSGSGNGFFEVIPNSGGIITSSTELEVRYNQLNANSSADGALDSYETQHYNQSGTGGYLWQRFDDFAAGNGAAPFQRSLESWCESTNVFWRIGENTNVDVVADDDINIVRFDNGAELPSGVLGRCTSRWSGCFQGTKNCANGTGSLKWFVSELDIVFNDGFTWNFGPGPTTGGAYDFESVSLHELGHGHQLGHVIDNGQVMHRSISNASDKRSLSADEIDGAEDVYNRSTSTSVCSRAVMATDVNCSALLPVELAQFDVQAAQRSVLLEWTTASEINNERFEVQRSDGVSDFETIGSVAGQGNSNEKKNYEFTDLAPVAGVNYYRLKQMDFDGGFTYSPVKSAEFTISSFEVSVFPNPAQSQIVHVKLSAPQESEVQIDLIDANGQMVFSSNYEVQKGIAFIPLALDPFASGIYWLRFKYNDRVELKQFVKM